jgi:soluble lytic murein transglycosylase-like protein
VSVTSIGARVEAIQARVANLQGTPAQPAGSFASTLAAAQQVPGQQVPGHQTSSISVSAASGATPGGSTDFESEINAAATSNGIDPALLKGLVQQESGFDPNARSGAGAIGLTQLMPSTAAALGVTDPTDPAQSLQGGARYLREQLDRFGGDERLALAAYNAGPGAVAKYGGVPPYAETQGYVNKVLANAASYRGAIA